MKHKEQYKSSVVPNRIIIYSKQKKQAPKAKKIRQAPQARDTRPTYISQRYAGMFEHIRLIRKRTFELCFAQKNKGRERA